ncbi:MAG TPA: hypothetical protein VII13_21280 [Vicinamibacteria bacterium]|jgi:cytochrome c-type biogenesis protein CcmH
MPNLTPRRTSPGDAPPSHARRWRRLLFAVALLGLGAAACQRDAVQAPPAKGETAAALASAGAAPGAAESVAPSVSPALPPGHPPAGDPHASTGSTMPAGHPPVGATKGGPSVAGTVSLGPSLGGRAKGEGVLFLIARAGSERQVVAVRREGKVTFPHAFELSAGDAMTAGTSFSGPLEITARLSATGDAMPAAGDVEGVARGVSAGARGIRVVLDTVRR